MLVTYSKQQKTVEALASTVFFHLSDSSSLFSSCSLKYELIRAWYGTPFSSKYSVIGTFIMFSNTFLFVSVFFFVHFLHLYRFMVHHCCYFALNSLFLSSILCLLLLSFLFRCDKDIGIILELWSSHQIKEYDGIYESPRCFHVANVNKNYEPDAMKMSLCAGDARLFHIRTTLIWFVS